MIPVIVYWAEDVSGVCLLDDRTTLMGHRIYFEYLFTYILTLHTNEWNLQAYCEFVSNHLKIKSSDS